MCKIEKLFFTLLRSAIWDTKPVLPHVPTKEEWYRIAELSKEQTVTGIMLDAIAKLPEEQRPDRKLLVQWIMQQKFIEKVNIKMNSVIKTLFDGLQSKGIRAILLKGQGVAQNYLNPLHRQCGDIDLYIPEEHFNQALEHFGSLGCKVENNPKSYHAETAFNGIPIELHKSCAKYYTKKLQRRYNDITGAIIGNRNTTTTIDGTEVEVLPYIANAFQLLSHTMRHIFSSGIALRQICDWVYFIYHNQKDIDREEFIAQLKTLQLYETYKAVTAIATDHLGLPQEFALCEISSKDKELSKKVLDLIMKYGNFGHYGEHNSINTKWEYLRSYLWKVRNCIRFRRIAGNEAWNFPLWQLHSIGKFLK